MNKEFYNNQKVFVFNIFGDLEIWSSTKSYMLNEKPEVIVACDKEILCFIENLSHQ